MNNQVNQDTEHLKILSICHYVLAGLCVVPLLYGVFYMILGIFFGAMLSSMPHRADEPPAALFSGIFIFIGIMIAVVALTIGLLLLKSGRNLSRHQNHTF